MTKPDDAEGNRELIRSLYAALDRGDGEAMGRCYRADATFRDPVFGRLDAAQTRAMWRMLTSGGEDLAVELVSCDADEAGGRAHWRATYTFPATGRLVANDIRATFRFADGRIAAHVDDFSLFAWARQAFGLIGGLVGWTWFGRRLLRGRVRAQLRRYSDREDPGASSRPPA